MVAAVELYFDHPAERRLRVLWDAFEAAGIPSMRGLLDGRHRPHLSLAVAESLDPAAVRDALDGFDIAPPLTLSFQFTGENFLILNICTRSHPHLYFPFIIFLRYCPAHLPAVYSVVPAKPVFIVKRLSCLNRIHP